MDDALFPIEAAPQRDPTAPLKPGERLRSRQLGLIALGMHPLTLVRTAGNVWLHPDASRTGEHDAPGPHCASCRFRVSVGFPKCDYPGVAGAVRRRQSQSQSSDVAAWFPACREYEAKEVG